MSKFTNLVSIGVILVISLLLYKFFSSNQENFELINNGSFNNSEDISSSKKGNNKIVKIENPSGSDYALMQDHKNSHDTYYEIETKVVPQMNYVLSCWYCETKNWNGKDNIINVKIPTKNKNYLPNCNLSVIETKKIKNVVWKKLKTKFKVPSDSKGIAQIFLGYKPDATKGYRYITDVSLSIDIPGVKNFPKSEELTTMVIGSSKCSYDSTKNNNKENLNWMDITGQGNNFNWGSNVMFNNQSGFFSFTDTSDQLLGPLIGNLLPDYNSDNFTLIARYTSTGNPNNEQTKKYGSLFTINGSGLDNTSLQLDIPNRRDNIILYFGGKQIKSKNKYNTMKDNIYILTISNNYPKLYIYSNNNAHNKSLNLELVEFLSYNGDTEINEKSKFNKMFFDYKKSFTINDSSNSKFQLFGNLYSVLVYKKALDSDSIRNIGQKLIKMKPDKFDCGGRPDMNEHFFDNGLNKRIIEHQTNKEDADLDDTSKLYCKDDKFKNDFDDSSGGTKHHDSNRHNHKRNSRKCNRICEDQCSDYTEGDIYNECIESCKEERIECGNTWPDGSRGRNWPNDGRRRHHRRHRRRFRDDCPIAYRKDGKYIVYIPKNSKEARELGKHGEFDYGRKRHHAKKIYEYNFPDCPIPEILDDNSHNPTIDSCPFIVREHNPCYSRACRDTDWSKWDSGDITNCKMSDRCKSLVDNYCSMYNQIDPACKCWDPSMNDDKKCGQFRNYFNTNDKCNINQFKITEHKDIGKYIKRDSIPCWNCDLDDARNINKKVERQYK